MITTRSAVPKGVRRLVEHHIWLANLARMARIIGSTGTLVTYRAALKVNGAAIRCKLAHLKIKNGRISFTQR